MNGVISPKFLMKLAAEVEKKLCSEYPDWVTTRYYLEKWIEGDDYNWQSFYIIAKDNNIIDLLPTLHSIPDNTLLKIAIDLGVDTPDFIPSIPTFRNEIKSDYKTASATFEKAFKQIEAHPDIAIGLVNSALESIIKEILKDERIQTKLKPEKTLYDLCSDLMKELQLFPGSEMPIEIRVIGSSLLCASQSIEKLRSEKTNVHGKTAGDYIIQDSIYAYFIVNSVATVGLFLNSYYKKKFNVVQDEAINDLPF